MKGIMKEVVCVCGNCDKYEMCKDMCEPDLPACRIFRHKDLKPTKKRKELSAEDTEIIINKGYRGCQNNEG